MNIYYTAGSPWTYAAAASGIVNTTTAVTVKAAVSGQRNYVTSIQLSHATLGAGTEFCIRDGAGGTVLWRIDLKTTALPAATFDFNVPLKGTAGNLLEIVTLTGVTGGVYANLQGFCGD